MNELQKVFNYNGKQVRTVMVNNEPYFVAKDVCDVLEISKHRDAVSRLDDDERGSVLVDTLGGLQEMTAVNEAGLYSLIMTSRKPEAKQFKRWVTHEVLPTIRKTGGYVSNDDLFINTYLPYADEQTKMLFRTTLETVKSLNAKIEQDKPKVLFADSVSASHTTILIGELAKILKQNGVDIGQNRLFEWLRRNGYLISRKGTDYNMPTQRAMDLGLFSIKETTVTHSDGHISINKTVKVTGKGQIYFINKFKEKSA